MVYIEHILFLQWKKHTTPEYSNQIELIGPTFRADLTGFFTRAEPLILHLFDIFLYSFNYIFY